MGNGRSATSLIAELGDRFGMIGVAIALGVAAYAAAPGAVASIVATYGLPIVTLCCGAVLGNVVEAQAIWWLVRELQRVQEARVREVAAVHELRVRDAHGISSAVLEHSTRVQVLVDRMLAQTPITGRRTEEEP